MLDYWAPHSIKPTFWYFYDYYTFFFLLRFGMSRISFNQIFILMIIFGGDAFEVNEKKLKKN